MAPRRGADYTSVNPHNRINHNTSFPNRNLGTWGAMAAPWNPALLKGKLVVEKASTADSVGQQGIKNEKP